MEVRSTLLAGWHDTEGIVRPYAQPEQAANGRCSVCARMRRSRNLPTVQGRVRDSSGPDVKVVSDSRVLTHVLAENAS